MKGKKAIQSKFPTARIKKIMQEDEEIGKVAAGAPIVISKALELFLRDLVLESTAIAASQGSKKIMPFHVKRLATQNRTYDFLDDLLVKYSDPTSTSASTPSGPTVSTYTGPASSLKKSAGEKPKAKKEESSESEMDNEHEGEESE